MTDPQSLLSSLRRPSLLVRAARHGAADYNRDRLLRRVLPGEMPPGPGLAFERLAEREAEIDLARREGGAAYSLARHVEALVALIEEARLALLRQPAAN